MGPLQEKGVPTPAACCGCPGKDCRPQDPPAHSLPSGWRLALVSTGLFLCPVVMAIAAASLARRPAMQFAGAIAGLGLGIAGSVAVGYVLRRGREKTP
jgi:hypothetical protein